MAEVVGQAYAPVQLLCEQAIGLLSTLSPRVLSRESQQYKLSRLASLPAAAAMVCLRGNSDVIKVWELLEVGSSIISGLAIDSKSDLTQLMETHPALAKQYSLLREEASGTTSDQSGHGVIRDPGRIRADGTHPTTRRHTAEQSLRDCESAIRSLPGFESFQLPFSPIQASLTASEGPIVAIVAHGMCSAALIVESNTFDILPLPELHLEDVEKNVNLILGRGEQSG
jgi:hypothetical protein